MEFEGDDVRVEGEGGAVGWWDQGRSRSAWRGAIAFLHEECLEWVLHCDIKPENILLDDGFCPKISDFRLSKLVERKERVSMSRVRGTQRYMAPITTKADVYSFGVAGMRSGDFRRESVESVDWWRGW